MKRNNDYYYSSVASFEDLRLEKARLKLKSRLIESKMKLDIIQIREVFSVSALVLTIVKKFIPTDIFDVIQRILNK
jgi:hypothetical protein